MKIFSKALLTEMLAGLIIYVDYKARNKVVFAFKWKLKHKVTGEYWKHPPHICLALKPDGAFLLVDSTDPWYPRVSYQCMDKDWELYIANTKNEEGNWEYKIYCGELT